MKIKRILPTKKDYEWILWTPANIKGLPEALLADKRTKYQRIKKIKPEKRTFENTIYAIEKTDEDLQDGLGVLSLLVNVSPKKSVRDSATEALVRLESELITIEYDKEVYDAVLEYVEGNGKIEKLTDEEKRLLGDMLRGYKRMGFDLPEKDQTRLQDIFKRLGELSTIFGKNIADYEDFILVTEEELRGLPEDYKKRLKKKDGKYVVTLDYPDYHPFIQKAENEKKRKEIAEKFWKRVGDKNLNILKELVNLRHELAGLLGYKTFADYRTEEKMVKTGDNALGFVTDLLPKLAKGVKKEVRDMERLKQKELGKNRKFGSHDIAFYSDKLKRDRYGLDSEALREYFPLEKVKQGTFEIYEKLLGISIKKIDRYALWHPDAEMYEIKDKKGTPVAHFFLDLYPRKGKYGHACVSPILLGHETGYRGSRYRAPSACLIANFTKPQEKNPSLLSHREVETFFHEFGHVMHGTLTKAPFASQSGLSVAWDFVEAPSQMLQNWTWEEDILRKYLSSHYKTGEPLPREMVESLIASKNHNIASFVTQQLTFALYDLTIHTEKVKNVNTPFDQLIKKYTLVDPPKGAKYPASFGHMAGGYDAGYYGYMYSLVFASDMFSRFKKEGVMNAKVGRDYRKSILEQGSSRDEIESVKDFLGRKPNNKAFLREIGLG